MIDYRIKPVEGFSKKIGEVVSMLEHTRAVTLAEIKSLSEDDLDYLTDDDANSIGALLLHVASIEFVHQVITFEERDLNDKELLEWKSALELGVQARKSIKNHSLDFYVNKLAQVRINTLNGLKRFSDDWLYEERKWENGVVHNYNYLWFHVIEDEINHRGQIRAIKRVRNKANRK